MNRPKREREKFCLPAKMLYECDRLMCVCEFVLCIYMLYYVASNITLVVVSALAWLIDLSDAGLYCFYNLDIFFINQNLMKIYVFFAKIIPWKFNFEKTIFRTMYRVKTIATIYIAHTNPKFSPHETFSYSCFSIFLFFWLMLVSVCILSSLFFSRKFFSYLKTLSFSVVLVYLFFHKTIQRKIREKILN